MYLKRLTISSLDGTLRNIEFHRGVNLIVDETDPSDKQKTGNNIGKTTVLKVIDYCLGAKAQAIYSDPENPKTAYFDVKDYLERRNVTATLVLTDDLELSNAREVTIVRNFLRGKDSIRRINGKSVMAKDFERELAKRIIPELEDFEKPTFRQVISHNIRFKDESVSHTLKTLDKFTRGVEYEALYLFMLGCPNDYGEHKRKQMERLKAEKNYYDRLRNMKSETDYELALNVIENEIRLLNMRKSAFSLQPDFENDMKRLNETKREINRVSSRINSIEIRISLVQEALDSLNKDVANIDVSQLKTIYDEATSILGPLHKTFGDLVDYHNRMLEEKARYISVDLPDLETSRQRYQRQLENLLDDEKTIAARITKGDSFKELEEIIAALNEQYKRKGETDALLEQLREIRLSIEVLEKDIDLIDADLFSSEFGQLLRSQVNKFNGYFSLLSRELYDEQYYLSYEIRTDKKSGRDYYEFESKNLNVSSGKKQGEILCFDMAYTLFADDEGISCLHFLANDKKELMHGNQLEKVAKFAYKNDVQLIFSILEDKLPSEMRENDYVVLRLSQQDKFFRMEKRESGL